MDKFQLCRKFSVGKEYINLEKCCNMEESSSVRGEENRKTKLSKTVF